MNYLFSFFSNFQKVPISPYYYFLASKGYSKIERVLPYSKKLWRGKNFGEFGKSQKFANFLVLQYEARAGT